MSELKVNAELTKNYNEYYDDSITEWRELGAEGKAENIITLSLERKHEYVLEIGCGEGSVLSKLSDGNFGSQLFGLEISESGVEMVNKRNIPRLTECKLYDGYRVPYEDKTFDLVILTHVVEHLEHPRLLLTEALRVGKDVFIEVPLEHTLWLKKDFVFDSVGHINFYTPTTIRNLVQSCGYKVLKQQVVPASLGVHKYSSGTSGIIKYYLKKIFRLILPNFAPYFFTYYSSLLCTAE
jgi:SAM-dependent methyltransferase